MEVGGDWAGYEIRGRYVDRLRWKCCAEISRAVLCCASFREFAVEDIAKYNIIRFAIMLLIAIKYY